MLKNKYHFEFPLLYKTLLEDRMFDYTAPQYLLDYKFFGADLEPFSFEESLQNYEDFPFGDKDPSKQIFPFAQTGGGDWYGFCFSMKNDTAKLSDCDLEKLYIKETAFTRFNEELYCGI